MSEQKRLPFERSYWVNFGELLAGYYPGSEEEERTRRKLEELLELGVRCWINLTEEGERNLEGVPFAPYEEEAGRLGQERGVEVICLRFPIRDMEIPSVEQMQSTLDAMDEAIGSGRTVYVHCWGGIGRTGTVVGCYLVRHGLAQDGDEAIAKIKEMRQEDPHSAYPSPYTEEQQNFVRRWQRGQ